MEDKDAYAEVNVFFVPQEARWNKITQAAHTEEIGAIIGDAMRAIERENRRLKDIMPKNYARNELDKHRLGNVVDLFTNIQMIEHGDSKDILGRAYEYCLSKFAENHSGNISGLSIYGQDLNPTTRKMALMNLAIRGIEADLGKFNADTFHNDLHPQLKADFILANPLFNLSDWNDGSLNDDQRWKFGLPPSGNANFAWLQHMIYHLAPNGKIGMVLANGSLSSQSSGEGDIRRKIVQADLLEGIIAMPTQLFYTTQIPVSLWFISRNKAQKGKTLFIDARKMGSMVNRRLREMTLDDISKIASAFEAFDNGTLKDVKGFCAAVTTAEIAKQDYILTPGRYVGIEAHEDDVEPFEEKMTRLTSELSVMFKRSHELEDEIRNRLGAIGFDL